MSTGRLPNLVVAGVPKAGTGSLFAYLTQHPDICGGDQKEVGYLNYYDPTRHTSEPPPLETYMGHFESCRDQRYVVDATPTYSYGGAPVIDAIRQHLQHPKIIISLRNPVERLWSAFTYQRTLGNLNDLPQFEEYLRVCELREREGAPLVPHDHLHGLRIGFYDRYIGLWLDAFGDDLKVIFAEDLARHPSTVLGDIFGWLGLDADVAPDMDLGRRNTTKHARSTRVAKLVYSTKRSADKFNLLPTGVRGPLRRAYWRVNAGTPGERLDPEMRRYVENIYKDSNAATAQALAGHGYDDLPGWLTAAVQRPS